MSQSRALSPFVKLNRDPDLDKKAHKDTVAVRCFACRQTSGLLPDLSCRKYDEEIALFKQVFLQQFPSDGGDKFRTNSHLCATCVPSVISVCGMYGQIVAIQKQIDRILGIMRDNLRDEEEDVKEAPPNDVRKEEESIDWSLLQMGEDSDDSEGDDAQDPISDPMMDIEFGVAIGSPVSSSDDEEENNSTPQRRLSSRAAKTKALQFLADTEIKTEPDDSDYDMDFNLDTLPDEDSGCDNATEEKTDDAQSCEIKLPKILTKRKSLKKKTPMKKKKKIVMRKSVSKKQRALNLTFKLEKNKLKPPKNSEGSYPCAKCGKTFGTWRVVLAHEITVCKIQWEKDTLDKLNFSVYECDQCDMKFVFATHLARHKNIHLNVKPFTCEKCGTSFSQNQSLTFHQRAYCGAAGDEISPTERKELREKVRQNQARYKRKLNFACTICPQKFTSQAKLDAHAKTPHKTIPCPTCGEQVTQGTRFWHMARAHPDQVAARLKCPKCDKSFHSRGGIWRHKLAAHGIKGVGRGKGVRKDARVRKVENVEEDMTENGGENMIENGDSTLEENSNSVENA